jgi:hypothetical protein
LVKTTFVTLMFLLIYMRSSRKWMKISLRTEFCFYLSYWIKKGHWEFFSSLSNWKAHPAICLECAKSTFLEIKVAEAWTNCLPLSSVEVRNAPVFASVDVGIQWQPL